MDGVEGSAHSDVVATIQTSSCCVLSFCVVFFLSNLFHTTREFFLSSSFSDMHLSDRQLTGVTRTVSPRVGTKTDTENQTDSKQTNKQQNNKTIEHYDRRMDRTSP